MRRKLLIRSSQAALLIFLVLQIPVRAAGLLDVISGAATPPAPVQCAPAPGGPTCDTGGPASQSGAIGINIGAGNPINLITGNKYQREVDLPPLPGVLGLEIVRHYNSSYSSHTTPTGILSRGWKLSYETELHVVGRTVQIVQADGSRILFNRNPDDPSQCASNNPAHGRIAISKTTRGDDYLWTWPDGRQLSFNHQGKLLQIMAPSGEFVSMQHDRDGHLLKVTDPQGRSLHLQYPERVQGKNNERNNERFKGVLAIASPVGEFRYEYGSVPPPGSTTDKVHLAANLGKAILPGQHSRHYHYEDARHPTRLTGITISGAGSDAQTQQQRIATWAYDINGRAVMSVRGEPLRYGKDGKPEPGTGIEQVTLDRSEPGKTILINSIGQSTVYKHAILGGEHRLLEVRGPGCASCGETNVRYRYDKLGRLSETTQLNQNGAPISGTRTEWDAMGRPVAVSHISYHKGKAGKPQWQLRHAYAADSPLPTVTARPSVVDGREHQTRTEYNRHGQPLTITESGWSPAIDGGEPTPISRSTTYRYTVINGKSLLTQTDGPLPNGPGNSPTDSDITLTRYDAKGGHPVEIVAPGNFKTVLADHGAAGHAGSITSSDGIHPAKTIRLGYAPRGQLTTVSRTIGEAPKNAGWGNAVLRFFALAGSGGKPAQQSLTTHIEYDVDGRPLRLTRPDGSWLQARHDQAGRTIEWLDAGGNSVRRAYDSENRVHASGTHPGSGAIPANAARYALDAPGILDPTADPTTAGERMQAGEDGGATATGKRGTVPTAAAPASTSAIKKTRDDFGRTLQVSSPDSGQQSFVFDAADRLLLAIDGNGNRTDYTYNAAGQLLKRVIHGRDSAGRIDTEEVSYRHAGMLLTGVHQEHQSSEYAYDADGRLVQKTDLLRRIGDDAAPGNRNRLRYVTRYVYDGYDRVQAYSLPSGEDIRISYGATGQAASLVLLSADRRATRPLIADMRASPILGLAAFTHGNGLCTTYHRNSSGQLSALQVADARPGRQKERQEGSAALAPAAFKIRHGAQDAVPSGARPLYTQQMDYDVNGLVSRIRRASRMQPGHAEDGIALYGYDQHGRLLQVETPTEKVHWRHDAAGNRLDARAENNWLPRQALEYAAGSNRLHTVSQDGTASAYSYDAAGNPVSIGKRRYVYNAAGRLVQVSEGGRILARYVYNADGERIAKTVFPAHGKTSTVYYLYQQNRLEAEADEQGKITAQYVYIDNLPVARLDYPGTGGGGLPRRLMQAGALFGLWQSRDAGTARIHAIHADHLGSPVLVTDSAQQPVWSAQYSAYGQARVTLGAISLNLRAPGQYFDDETGTHYNYFRDYDPATGRYLQPDPIEPDSGEHAYAYAGLNPVSGIDPYGLFVITINDTGGRHGPTYGGMMTVAGDNGRSVTVPASSWPNPTNPSPGIATGVYPATYSPTGHQGRTHGVRVNNGGPVTTIGPNPAQGGRLFARGINIHCGYRENRRGSAGCITIEPRYCEQVWDVLRPGETGTVTITR